MPRAKKWINIKVEIASGEVYIQGERACHEVENRIINALGIEVKYRELLIAGHSEEAAEGVAAFMGKMIDNENATNELLEN